MKSLNKKLCSMKKVNGKVKFVSYGKPIDYYSIKKFIKMDKYKSDTKKKFKRGIELK